MKRGPKFQRSSTTRQRFLKARGLTKTPQGKIVAHRRSLWEGGTDTLRNLTLKKRGVHTRQTRQEARERARRK